MQTHQNSISTQSKSSANTITAGAKKIPAPIQNGLQEMADESEQVKQLQSYQSMADQYTAPPKPRENIPLRTGRPVMQQKSGKLLNHETQNPFGAVIQQKKSGKPANDELAKLLDNNKLLDRTDDGDKIFASLVHGGEEETAYKVWEFVNEAYDKNLAKGKDLYAKLKAHNATQAITGESKEKTAQEARLNSNNAANAAKFSTNYKTTVAKTDDKYELSSTGIDPVAAANKGEQADLDKMRKKRKADNRSADYVNFIYPEKGEIVAEYNVMDFDMAKFAPGGRLNNSDMIWNQYKLAANEHYKKEEGEVTASIQRIEKIERSGIVNGNTLATMYMTYDSLEGMAASQEWEPEVNDFMALLGTPNARSAAFMLTDYVQELQKNITGIETNDDNMTISFEAVPRPAVRAE